ncbi:MAG: glycosyltransferase [Acidimicrobiia bacterium]|nr:glycosyltransferase [Acidimicrobiia bacterium]
MRVLVVLDNADRYTTLWETVPDLGVDLHVVAPAEVATRMTERPGLTVHPVDDRFLRKDRETWRIFPGLHRLVRAVEPDLVHLTTEPWSLVTLQALTTRRPVVVHGAEIDIRSGSSAEIAIRAIVCRWTLARVAGFVGWSALAVDAVRDEGLPASTPTVVAPAEVPDPTPFGPATARRSSFRDARGWADDDVVVGFVGRHVPEKGLAWLLAAVERTTSPALRLSTIGEGPDVELVRRAERTSSRRVHHHGPVAMSEVPEVMASLDVLVVPSTTTSRWREQFGRVVVESMSAGTPVVSSDSGALPEVVGDAGILVPEGNIDALASALDLLADSPSERTRLAIAARERANDLFAPGVVADRIVALWRSIARSDTPTVVRPSSSISVDPDATSRGRPVVAVLMATHDRRSTTLLSLERLFGQTGLVTPLEVFLVDDGSTDGTAIAVADRFPAVHLIEGNGSLFWSGAMRLAQSAARGLRPDFLLWLNDDVALDADALERLLHCYGELRDRGEPASVVVGALTDPDAGTISYSGVDRPDRRRPTHFEMIDPTDELQQCETANGNLVLVPSMVFRRLDGFDGSFRHAMSDYDFGLRARSQGCGVWLAPGTFGTCRRDHREQPWLEQEGGIVARTRMLVSAKGLPPGDWLRFTRRHAGPLWPFYFASPYSRFVARILRGG